MDERGSALDGLHEVRFDGILKEQCERARRAEFLGMDGTTAARPADEDASEAAFHIRKSVRKAENRHHLRGDRDIKARLARDTVDASAEPRNDVAKCTVVDVEDALPDDAVHVEIERVALKDVVVNERSKEIVRRRDGMKIPRKVEVDVLHRHDLRIAAARRAALHTKARAKGRLTQGDNGLLALTMERVGKSDARRGLALARRGRVDRRDEDEFAVRILRARKCGGRQLRLIPAVRLDMLLGNAECLCDLRDGAQLRRACDLHIGFHRFTLLSLLSAPLPPARRSPSASRP